MDEISPGYLRALDVVGQSVLVLHFFQGSGGHMGVRPNHKCFLYLETAYNCMQRGTLLGKFWECGLNDHSGEECLVCVVYSISDSFPVGVGLCRGYPSPT